MHRIHSRDVVRTQEALHSVVTRADDVQRHRRPEEPLAHERAAERRLGAVEDAEEREALLGFVGVDGRVVFVFEDLQREERIEVDLHCIQEGEGFDAAYLEPVHAFVLEFRDRSCPCEVVQEGADRPELGGESARFDVQRGEGTYAKRTVVDRRVVCETY